LNVLDWQRQSTVFESIAAFQEWDGILTFKGKSEPARVNWVTPNLMTILGLKPLHGGLLPDGQTPAPGLVLPYGVWKNRFGGDPSGRLVNRSKKMAWTRIVGVLPPTVAAPAQGARR
jgi:hypothetical protein